MLFKHFGEFLEPINFILFKKNSIIYYFPRLVSNYLGISHRSRGHFKAQTTQYTLEYIEILFHPTIPINFGSISK